MNEDFGGRREPADTAAAAPAASEPDRVNGLERPAQLGDQGILTDDEFEAKKKQILGIRNARFRRRRELPLADRS
jgi:Short C-terminal domain